MYSICYVSNAVFPRSDISNLDILRSARRFNASHGITGYLVRSPARFAQVLEGSEAEVKALYAHISNDRRHFEPQILAEGRKSERLFADWDMGFAEIGSDAEEALFQIIKDNASGDMFLPAFDKQHLGPMQGAR